MVNKKEEKMVAFSITLSESHKRFIDSQSRQFNLSKFVRVSIDAYIEYVGRLKIKDGEKNV